MHFKFTIKWNDKKIIGFKIYSAVNEFRIEKKQQQKNSKKKQNHNNFFLKKGGTKNE